MKERENACAPPVALVLVLTTVLLVAFGLFLWASAIPATPFNNSLFFYSLAALAIGYSALIALKYVGGEKTLRNRVIACLSLTLIASGTLGMAWVTGNEQGRVLWEGYERFLREIKPFANASLGFFVLSIMALSGYLFSLFGSLVERGELT